MKAVVSDTVAVDPRDVVIMMMCFFLDVSFYIIYTGFDLDFLFSFPPLLSAVIDWLRK
jgi:hypothetical protein